MFVGHYAGALALKALKPRMSLGMLCIGVQLVDYAWDLFVVVGIEKMKIVPGITASNALDLVSMPYTHSLLATLLWALLVMGLAMMRMPKSEATFLGIAVASHWFGDLLVHIPDLSLAGDATPKVGLGLWQFPWIAGGLELGLFLGTAFWCGQRTRPRGPRWAWPAFLGFGIFANLANYLGPLPETVPALALSAAATYTVFTALGFAVDRQREPR